MEGVFARYREEKFWFCREYKVIRCSKIGNPEVWGGNQDIVKVKDES
jgi:hypothetical protein